MATDTKSANVPDLPEPQLGASDEQMDMFGGDPHGFQALHSKLSEYLSDEQLATVFEAYELGAQAHSHQRRKSGEPYICHPVAVAAILAEMQMDYQTVVAAILHDVIEDTDYSKEQLAEQFGEVVAELVDGVSKITQLKARSKRHEQAENFSKMLLAMSNDIRVIVIKLADRLHNMRTMGAMRRDKQVQKSQETLDIYAPIAIRLGMNNIRVELEDLAFQYLHPLRFATLKKVIEEQRVDQEALIETVCEDFREQLKEEGIEAQIAGRKKHLWGIYKKIRQKVYQRQSDGVRLRRDQILDYVNDAYGVRIIVESVGDCYRVLGIAHNSYRPLLKRFKDYIAIPKANGYQSLHTCFRGPKGQIFEVQVRTHAMHRHAESGIASHWMYKSGVESGSGEAARANKWLRELLEMRGNADDSEEFLEHVKIDLFPGEVYVFSPRGDVFRLPKGATTVDFAYAIHTKAGDHCYGARVDSKRVLLRSRLKNGQTVEILTDENAHPDPAWLNFVVTGRARSRIRHYMRNVKADQAERTGRQLLMNALAHHGLKIADVDDEALDAMLKEFNVDSLNSLYIDIGMGNRLAPLVAKRIAHSEFREVKRSSGFANLFRRKKSTAQTAATTYVSGTEGLSVQMAKCCHPIPGDAIVGHLSGGAGVSIHHSQCRNLNKSVAEEQWIDVQWERDIGELFTALLYVHVGNKRGALANVTAAISGANSDIEHVEIQENERTRAEIKFQVRVRDRKHLAEVIRSVKTLSEVKKVVRNRG